MRRQAYVHVRQSSLQQVWCHQESRWLQYELGTKAEDLGWSQVEVIDEDHRLARNNADWYRLLDLCSLARALIVDSEAVYDPRLSNHRLLHGLKGTMSEAELSLLRERAQQGLLSNASRGELETSLPMGFVLTPEGCLEKDQDRRMQESIQGVFAKFSETGSARQTLLKYRREGIRSPV